ncbi:MAG: Type 1 glutamine amidotransferase-like domain-containing protein [bacterium]
MKLFLASLASETLDLITPLLPSPQGLTLRVAFITTAADQYDERPWLDNDRAKLVSMGFLVTDYDLKGKTIEMLRQDLSTYQIIFVAGGNTFYLLDHVRKSGFDVVIKELLQLGVIYVGSSAGSIIMCPTIEFFRSLDMPSPEMTDFRGLGIFNQLIIPHYGREKYAERHAKLIAELKDKPLPYEILPLRDDQAVMINEDVISIVTSK